MAGSGTSLNRIKRGAPISQGVPGRSREEHRRNRSRPEGNAARAVLERRQHRIGLADARLGPIAHAVREHRSEASSLARIEKRAIVIRIREAQWLEATLEDV